jgi:hypothetical protein
MIDAEGRFYHGSITRVAGSFGQVRLDHFRRIAPGESISLRLPIVAIHDFASPQSHVWTRAFAGRFVMTLVYSNGVDTYTDASEPKKLAGAWTGRLISNSVVLDCR